ncbi:MAG: DUF4411 family protein [Gemmatimonadetes bacterium]|nr:DUF4411 family protein [Gemmatimonadota bacterium]
MAYLLDADAFIRAKNLHYGFEICPGFWDWLVKANERGGVFSIEKVADEIAAGDDDLSVWAGSLGDGFFLKPTMEVLVALGTVGDWTKLQGYNAAAIDTFLQVADYHLVDHALAGGFDVVTHEIPSPSLNRIKIPNVCIGLGLKCLTPFEMLRREKARFVLETLP